MNKKVSVGLTIAAVAIAVAVTFCLTVNLMTERFNNELGDTQTLKSSYEKLQELERIIAQNAYFEVTDDGFDASLGRACAAALRAAGDEYACYYTAEEYAAREKQGAGENDGFGITVQSINGQMTVYSVVHGSPAYQAGIKANDVILAIASETGKPLAQNEYASLAATMGKNAGTLIFTVLRGETEKQITVTPSDYKEESVYTERVGTIEVVHITGFLTDTDEQFATVMNNILLDGTVTGIVFDVRQNGGGYLASAVNMLDRLLPEGVIVTEKDKTGKEIARYSSDAACVNLPMAVLVDESTASAAELFACALRDYGKAKLVGNNTYGKGCVQSIYTFSDGSAISFTTALYDPPASENYNGKCLVPDVTVSLTEEQKLSRYALTAETDPQLSAALSLLNNR